VVEAAAIRWHREANRDRDDRDGEPLGDDTAEQSGGIGAERRADAEVPAARGDPRREHAVNATGDSSFRIRLVSGSTS
jgi:hypothetical protein